MLHVAAFIWPGAFLTVLPPVQAFVCHIGFVADGQPYVIPTGFARDGEQLYFHGSVGSRMLRALESGSGRTCTPSQCSQVYLMLPALPLAKACPQKLVMQITGMHSTHLLEAQELLWKLIVLHRCADICVTVTLLDGLVLARSQFNTDMVSCNLQHMHAVFCPPASHSKPVCFVLVQ